MLTASLQFSSAVFLIRSPVVVLCAAVVLFGCTRPDAPGYGSVDAVLRQARAHATAPGRADRATDSADSAYRSSDDDDSAETLATVDGTPIDRQRVVSLLLRGHGAGLIEQLAVLKCAERRASRTGVVVTQADIDAEYDRSLQRAAASLGFESSDETVRETDRRRTEQWLDAYLAQRNVSPSEFDLLVRINAYLRALTEHELTVDVEQLRLEFERTHGPKVEVRHIQLATLAEANRVADRIKAGESFSALARLYSANIQSAVLGGLLPAFTANDPDVPALLREAAFTLQPGQVSMPIRIDPWYHLVRGERRIAAVGGSFEESRSQLEHRVRERSIRPLMERLYTDLLDGADIRISDPDLRHAFEHRRSDR